MILAGTDTLTGTLEWSNLLNHPEILKNARTESDIKNLPYLENIVSETLRLYPVARLFYPMWHLRTAWWQDTMFHVEQCCWWTYGPCIEIHMYGKTRKNSNQKSLRKKVRIKSWYHLGLDDKLARVWFSSTVSEPGFGIIGSVFRVGESWKRLLIWKKEAWCT